jgi:hypothetical protein
VTAPIELQRKLENRLDMRTLSSHLGCICPFFGEDRGSCTIERQKQHSLNPISRIRRGSSKSSS